jgi:hypothetical protein
LILTIFDKEKEYGWSPCETFSTFQPSLLDQKYFASSPVDLSPFTGAIDHVIHRLKSISEVIGLFAIISVLLDSRREEENSELDSSDYVDFIFL